MDLIKELLGKMWEEFGWLIGGLAVIAVLWFFNGGTQNESAHGGAYIKPLAPVDTGETYGRYYAGTPTTRKETLNLPEAPANLIRSTETAIENLLSKTKEAQQIHATSLLANSLYIDGVAGAKSSDASSEYIRIVSSPKAAGPIKLSGLFLQGTYFDGSAAIPKASGADAYLAPGGRAIISTGVSPVGGSFRVNACSNYLAGADKLVPALRKSPYSIYSGKMTYEQCLAAHKGETGFNYDEWRLFLGQTIELWRNGNDVIRLVDSKGGVVDALSY